MITLAGKYFSIFLMSQFGFLKVVKKNAVTSELWASVEDKVAEETKKKKKETKRVINMTIHVQLLRCCNAVLFSFMSQPVCDFANN